MININVGVLGHVDSGKTNICKALSTIASTAAFDKNPESKRRGITIDLGFSSFQVDKIPESRIDLSAKYSSILFTLVDCPGHASLIKTIICGAQIIDMILLVIDIKKGIQTQTAECIVIGQITCKNLIVVINKIDLIPEGEREAKIAQITKILKNALKSTKFSKISYVAVSAAVGGSTSEKECASLNIDQLITQMVNSVEDPSELRAIESEKPFLFAVDHCFNIGGKGTVLTGTVIQGCLSVGETIEMPLNSIQKKVLSMQMFKKPVDKISTGFRAGICIPQIDSKTMERGIVCKPKTLPPTHACILADVEKVTFFKGKIASKKSYHVSVGQETLTGTILIFHSRSAGDRKISSVEEFPKELYYDEELPLKEDRLSGAEYFLLINFDRPVCCAVDNLLIGSKLDTDIHSKSCRIAFSGKVLVSLTNPKYHEVDLPKLTVFKTKIRNGKIERATNSREIIVKNLFKKGTDWSLFDNLKITLMAVNENFKVESMETDQNEEEERKTILWSIEGVITGNFGQTGKCRVYLNDDLPNEVVKRFTTKGKNAPSEQSNELDYKLEIILKFKRFVFNKTHRFVQ